MQKTKLFKKLRLLTIIVVIAASVTFSTGCSLHHAQPPNVNPCVWVETLYFSAQTKEWLESLEWPESAYEDFDKIARHNEKVLSICGPK